MNFALLLTALGAVTGVASQTLLTRLRRGASVHTGWCAVGVAALWAVAGWRTETGHLPWWWLPIPLVVAWFAVTLTVVDLKHRRLPNVLTLAAYPAVAVATTVAATQSGWQIVEGALLGGAALTTMYLAIHLMWPTAMGGGDVKLSGSQGAVLGAVGWPAVLVGTTLAAVLTLVLNAAAPKRRRESWRTGIPHGPALLAATYLVATFPAIQG
ncbi:prepilin peptidase [Actinophytocola algeriensis]|uniref:Leader peptidase (Prepilin peptidase)/N-methyltransferase n=1 Tax=Actinophytocola algeriensis TaxID=1768010 RepID=A0A7W7Q8K4_9PSEU|nr:A24 family peptidase [Actinophytocola algeriensis]MBB4908994.1 leader peptidase (prepilin peptidase)/N-methyltransferase [Actinophytocola algeriensis]MBE1474618.1 leader peptidase (prepilin peptidase)/N-methyltransferase [Actinophytocola algeriensis]